MNRELKYAVIDSTFTVSAKQDLLIPDVYSSELLIQSLLQHADETILIDASSGERMTGHDVLTKSTSIARSLHHAGLSEGDRVFCSCHDTHLYACTILGIQFAGLVYSGNFWMVTKREVATQVTDLVARAIFCSDNNLDIAAEVADEVDSVKIVIVLSPVQRRHTRSGKEIISMQQLLQLPKSNDLIIPVIPVLSPAEAPAYIMYSSGSTGLPKGCIITHRNDISRCLAIAQRQGSGRKVLSLTVGFPHTVGLMVLRVAIIRGNTVVIDNQIELDLNRYLTTIERYKCRSSWLGPSQLTTLSKNMHLLDQYDVSCLKEIKTGGAVLSESVMLSIESRTSGRIKVRNVYGLTEVGDITIMPDDVSGSSVGSLVPAQYIRIADRETGVPLDITRVGEILVSGPQVTPGYFHRPDADEEHFTTDGWFRTGDMGYVDQEGLLFIIDRYKEVIKVFGEQVTPGELESLLLSHDAVAEAAVVGVPDDVTCEAPVAFVVLKPGISASSDEILDYVHHQVVEYKRIRDIFFQESLPKISIGKINRKQLKLDALRKTCRPENQRSGGT